MIVTSGCSSGGLLSIGGGLDGERACEVLEDVLKEGAEPEKVSGIKVTSYKKPKSSEADSEIHCLVNSQGELTQVADFSISTGVHYPFKFECTDTSRLTDYHPEVVADVQAVAGRVGEMLQRCEKLAGNGQEYFYTSASKTWGVNVPSTNSSIFAKIEKDPIEVVLFRWLNRSGFSGTLSGNAAKLSSD